MGDDSYISFYKHKHKHTQRIQQQPNNFNQTNGKEAFFRYVFKVFIKYLNQFSALVEININIL